MQREFPSRTLLSGGITEKNFCPISIPHDDEEAKNLLKEYRRLQYELTNVQIKLQRLGYYTGVNLHNKYTA